MKKLVLIVGLLLFITCCGSVFAQNKTLGVGVATPNPNAALHVESPTGNQGFILPRLTTAQRTATTLTSILKDSDNGLMVYDTNLNTIFIWNGLTWKSSAQVAGGPKLIYPYGDTVMTALADKSSVYKLIYAGSTAQNVSVGKFENWNAANTGAALHVTTNGVVGTPATASAAILGETSTAFSAITGMATGGLSNGIAGISSSPDPGSYAILGSNSGGGPAGVFTQNLATNATTALQATTSGVGGAGKFQVNNVASPAPALWVQTNSNQPLSTSIYGLNTGTGDAAAVFRINNASNTFSAAFAETNGSGPAFYANQTGTGSGIIVVKNGGGPANAAAIFSRHLGTSGYAGIFQNENAANPRSALFAESLGAGESIWAQKSLPTSTGDAIFGQHMGSTGRAGYFENTNAANTSPAFQASTAGLASAGVFQQTNTEVWNPALTVQTSGQGAAIAGTSTSTYANASEFVVSNPANTRFAVMANTQGTGSAGSFENNNISNTSPAITTATNGSGPAIQATNSANGVALAIWGGV